MIEAGCYSINVRCDTDHRSRIKGINLLDYDLMQAFSFNGESRRECIAEAKSQGWIFKRNGKTYCPHCAYEMRPKTREVDMPFSGSIEAKD